MFSQHSMSPTEKKGSPGDVSALLIRWGEGDQRAFDELMPLVYARLRRLAQAHLRGERSDISLQGTELVHEAYLRLGKQEAPGWKSRQQFFTFAAHVMRRILVDHARKTKAGKRWGSKIKVPLDAAADAPVAGTRDELEILALDRALDGLTRLDERLGQIVELRFFGGFSIAETAELLGLSEATIKREWLTARAWLHRAIRKGASTPR
jgi:RNA polymerase sigma factor (TIGR02999 family)